MLGDLISHLDRPDIIVSLLSTMDPDLTARVEARAAAVSMTTGEFASGAVREFVGSGGRRALVSAPHRLRKAEDPGLAAIRTILEWTVTERQ
ncbi:MAG TPA: hypothetical protein VFT69_01325 [Pseudolabrys sp.]|jgi:hypothetical protein|nr:hypothetical protein [Pseudolabrys sp.]